MPILRRQLLLYIFALSDLGLLLLALYLSIFERAALTPISSLVDRTVQVHTIAGLAVLALAWRAALTLLGLYRSKRLDPLLPELLDLLQASAVATLLLALVSAIFRIRTIGPGVLSRFLVSTIVCLIASRLVMRQGLRAVRRHGHNLRHMLIVGTNDRAVTFANSIAARPELGYRLVGYVDETWTSPMPRAGTTAEIVSDIPGFRSYLRNHVIDEVTIALPIKSFYDETDKVIQICQEHGVIVRVLTNLFEKPSASTEFPKQSKSRLHTVEDAQYISTINPRESLAHDAKRLLDLAVASCALLALSPILVLAAFAIKLTSPGPIFFLQERIGLNKRRFKIIKLRTMVPNAEKLMPTLEQDNEAQGPVFKMKNDPRITPIGKFLRKSSIDELPQLINVLTGEMSLVGPRPLPVRDYQGFSEDWQRRRFSVRPGITCLWQVNGRSGITFDQWMLLDLKYMDEWSLWLDLKILAKTVPAVLRGSGAV